MIQIQPMANPIKQKGNCGKCGESRYEVHCRA